MIEELDGLVCIGFDDPRRRFGLRRVHVLSTSLGRLHVQGEPAVLAVVEGDDTAAFQALLKDAYQVTLTPSASSPLLSPGHEALFISAVRAAPLDKTIVFSTARWTLRSGCMLGSQLASAHVLGAGAGGETEG